MSYVSSSEKERQEMLKEIGVTDFAQLITGIPENLRLKKLLDLPPTKSEFEVIQNLKKLASQNRNCTEMICFLGGGAYDHYIPAAVDTILSRSEFLTAYTPYQAEVSQGTLQTIYEFQSLVCCLTGLPIANASMYDGASATAEAVLLALLHTNLKKVLLSSGLHLTYRQVIQTYTSGLEIEIESLPEKAGLVEPAKLADYDLETVACVVVQSPNFHGLIESTRKIKEILQGKKTLFIVVTNPLSLALLATPAEVGADVAVGEMQVFGNSLNYGGPYVGYFAAREEYLRKIPGRLVARTKDVEGKTGYVLTLQTREQHIRRDKATSNICTNQALCALAATVYLTLLGETGLREVASESVKKAHYLADQLVRLPGFSLVYEGRFFNEFTLKLPLEAEDFAARMEQKNILAGVPLSRFYSGRQDQLLVAVTEKRTKAELDLYVKAAAEIGK